MSTFQAWVIVVDTDANRGTSVDIGYVKGEVIAALPPTLTPEEASVGLRAVAQALYFRGDRSDVVDFAQEGGYISDEPDYWTRMHPYLAVKRAKTLEVREGKVFFEVLP